MRMPPPRRRGIAAVCLAVFVAVLAVVQFDGVGPASAAVAQLPFTVVNNSGRAGATYIYVVARNLTTGQQGYVDAGGTWHAFPFPASVPPGQPNPAAPDVSIAGPGTGASKAIVLAPNLSGGRIYVAIGTKLQFFMTPNGLVEPAPWVATDPNHDTLYDWAEFARVGNAIFINTTTVDMFSIPMSVSVTASNGSRQTQGITAGRGGVLNAISALGGDWARLTYTRASDGLPLRVLAPTHGIANGVFSGTYLDAYIAAVWTYYASHPMTVDTSLGTFTGTAAGTNLTFRTAAGAVIGTLPRPSTNEVFGCSGATQPGGQPNETAILAVGARVCAALHRATLSTASRVMSDRQPTTDATQFYQQSASDLYSKVIHSFGLGGLAYGFSYDDVGGFAPVIDQPDPASASLTLGSLGTSGPAATTITGPGGKCVDISGDDTGGNGAPVQLWDCQAVAVDQHWTWTGTALTTLGRCLDVQGGGTANTTKLQLWDCNGTGAQQWIQQADGSMRNPQSGRCMDSPGGATANGTRLQIYDCNGTAAQKFHKN
jgi:hypothetical protein